MWKHEFEGQGLVDALACTIGLWYDWYLVDVLQSEMFYSVISSAYLLDENIAKKPETGALLHLWVN